MPVLVFVAYAHQDEPYKNELLKHLSPLRRAGVIAAWHDRRIVPGMDWEQTIDEQLHAAQIILPLISADFINSEYCYGIELQQALERHRRGDARLVPIILRPCHWQRLPIATIQVLPQDGTPVAKWRYPDDAYAAITKSIDEIATQLNKGTLPDSRKTASEAQNTTNHTGIAGSIGKLPVILNSAEAPDSHVPPRDRPRICATAWTDIPDGHPVRLRAGQTGFCLANDGGAAYEITIDPFTISPGKIAKGETLPRIPPHSNAFALVWQEGFSHLAIATGKWDLLHAMRDAAGDSVGLYGGPDYTVIVSITYRDADGTWWYRSTTPLTYIRSQDRLSTGTPQHKDFGHTRASVNATGDPVPVLAFRAWHAADDFGRPRMATDDQVPSFISVKNVQTAIPVTAERVTAHLQYRNAAGQEFTIDHAPWYITSGSGDSDAHWADATTIDASATASFALFVSDKDRQLWIYRDPYKRVAKLEHGRWVVTMTVTSTTTTGFTGTLTFTHTKHDGLQPNKPAFSLTSVLPPRP
jgi:hypothetical protein